MSLFTKILVSFVLLCSIGLVSAQQMGVFKDGSKAVIDCGTLVGSGHVAVIVIDPKTKKQTPYIVPVVCEPKGTSI